jgi:hypothetical protein
MPPKNYSLPNDSAFGARVDSINQSISGGSHDTARGSAINAARPIRRASQQYSAAGANNHSLGAGGGAFDGFDMVVQPPPAARPLSTAPGSEQDPHDDIILDPNELAAAMAPQCKTSFEARQFLEGSDEVFVKVEAVRNLPLSVGCTEVTLSFADPRGRAMVHMPELPSIRKVQDEVSVSAAPTFTGCSLVARVKPKAQLVVTVTCLDFRTKQCGVLGHVVLPTWNKRGIFELRLRDGKPNSDIGSALGDSVLFVPLTTVVVHVNVRPGEQREEPVRLMDFSHNESLLITDRKGKISATMQTLGLTQQACDKAFRDYNQQRAIASGDLAVVHGQATAPPKERPFDTALYSFYNEKRGLAIVVHALYYCIPQDRSPLQLFKVVVEVDARRGFTQFHDWGVDPFRPKFIDSFFTFADVRLRSNLGCVLRVYRMKFSPKAGAVYQAAAGGNDSAAAAGSQQQPQTHPRPTHLRQAGEWTVEEYGWGAVGLASQLSKNTLRHSATLPVRLYQGRVPDELFDVVQTKNTVEEALSFLMERGTIQLHRKTVGNQAPILTISIADPARLDEIVTERTSSNPTQPKSILADEFKKIWPKPSQVQADSNAYFKAMLFASADAVVGRR